MSKLMSTLTLAAVSTFAFTSSAFAGDTDKTNMTPASLKTSITVVEEVKSSDNAMMIEASTEVRGAVERGDYMSCRGPRWPHLL